MELLPDEEQRSAVSPYFQQFKEKFDVEEQMRQASLQEKVSKQKAKKAQKPQAQGWGRALAQYGANPQPVVRGLTVGNRGTSAFTPTAGRNDTKTPAASGSSANSNTVGAPPPPAAAMPSHPIQHSWTAAPPSFTKSEFPTLPTAGPKIGRATVTRDTWDEQAQTIAKNRTKSKKKKNKMSLGEFAMLR